jgi:hypothetical protein
MYRVVDSLKALQKRSPDGRIDAVFTNTERALVVSVPGTRLSRELQQAVTAVHRAYEAAQKRLHRVPVELIVSATLDGVRLAPAYIGLEPGELDQRARMAYHGGQCHSLAMELQNELGWPIFAAGYSPTGCGHCGVLWLERDLVLDIEGLSSPSAWAVYGEATMTGVSQEEIWSQWCGPTGVMRQPTPHAHEWVDIVIRTYLPAKYRKK